MKFIRLDLFHWSIVFLCLPSSLLVNVVYGLETRPLGTLELILRSRAPLSEDSSDTMYNLLSVTVSFLSTVMYVYFEDDKKVQFEKISATLEDYSIREEDGTTAVAIPHYLATVVMSGVVSFQNGAAADQDIVTSITKTAFVEANEDFLKALWENESDPFLRQVSTAIVKVNDITDHTNDTQTHGTTDVKYNPRLATWAIALLAGGGSFILVLAFCFACIWSNKFEENPVISEPMKTTTTRETVEEEEESRDGVSETNAGTNFGTNAQRSPSTIHSITSQDSSLFTYNPKSVRSYTSNGSKTFGSGIFTANSGLEMDLQAWQNGGTLVRDENQIPFGNDISAITNKKDLSLIQEEDLDDASTGRNMSETQQYFQTPDGLISPRQYLTEAAVQDLEIRDRWGSRNNNSTWQAKSLTQDGIFKTNTNVVNTSIISRFSSSTGTITSRSSKMDFEGPSSDVIDDLKDLSYQIDAYRQRLANS